MGFPAVFSVRNVLRASGVLVLSVGAPMVVVPGLATMVYWGKRSSSFEADKDALTTTMRALGISLTAGGLHCLTVPVSKVALGCDMAMEGMFCVYHWGNRFSNKWKEADGNMTTNLFFAILASGIVVIQATALAVGDEPKDK